jgi:DedD protein
MAFFKFRKGGDDQTAAAAPPESIEAMRKRAKHRLMGTAILVLIGVIGFPLLVDKQPRPVAVDVPIEIPDKDQIKPLAPPPPAPPLPVVTAPAAPLTPPSASAAGRVGQLSTVAPAAVKPAAAAAPKPAQAAAPAKERFVVQVGAFSDPARARDAHLKLERAGLKAYTQEVVTKEGRRIRVRVGPFDTKALADKAAEKIKKLDLPAAVLIL